jgi:hypothetical protein
LTPLAKVRRRWIDGRMAISTIDICRLLPTGLSRHDRHGQGGCEQMNDAAIRRLLVAQFEDGRDLDTTHEMYHDDAILEFPQSGERFIGKQSFLTWRKQYPSKVKYTIRGITGHGDLWVLELLVTYDGSAPMFGVGIVRFRGDRIARETVYAMASFDAPAWRREWATPFDPLASVAPADWTEDAAFPLEAVAG